MTLLLPDSAEMSEQPVWVAMKSTRFQVRPPAAVLHSPRSSLGPHSRPNAQAYTTFASRESMTRRAMRSDFSRPMRVQCSPPSTDRYTPSPIDALLRGLPSPVPAETTFGFEGATAIAPIYATVCPSKTGLNVVPPLVVLMIP